MNEREFKEFCVYQIIILVLIIYNFIHNDNRELFIISGLLSGVLICLSLKTYLSILSLILSLI